MRVKSILRGLEALVWPHRCIGCNQRLLPRAQEGDSAPFCPMCKETLIEVMSPKCSCCSLPFDDGKGGHRCGECLQSPPAFNQLVAAYQYGGAAEDAMIRFKYGDVPHLAREIARLLLPLLQELVPPEVVVPVPLHPIKLRRRGYNQSALLAGCVAASLGLPLNTRALVRIRNTRPQAGQTREQRLLNVKGAFAVVRPKGIPNKRVLVVDDVVTTCTTVREVSAVLKKSGAAAVDVAAFIRAV